MAERNILAGLLDTEAQCARAESRASELDAQAAELRAGWSDKQWAAASLEEVQKKPKTLNWRAC